MDRLRLTHMHNKVTQSLRKANAKFSVSITEGAKGNGKVWQTLNESLGKDNKYENCTFELKIDNILNDPIRIENTFNNELEISVFTPPTSVPCMINIEQPSLK